MAKHQANELKVGIVVLACLVLGLVVAMQLSDWEQWLEEKNTLTFKLPYQAGIGGIRAGWPVSSGGVTVGSVEEIWLNREEVDPQDLPEPSQIEQEQSPIDQEQPTKSSQDASSNPGPKTYSYFKFTIPKKYQLRDDCALKPATQLIGGAGELVITDLGKGKLLKDQQVVFRTTLGKTGMAVMMDEAKGVMAQAKGVMAQAQQAMTRINEITKDLKHVSAEAKEAISLSRPQLKKIIANVRAASTEMKEGMREIRWNPWRLLHNPTNRELRTQNLLAAARAFSSGASDVDAAVGRLEGLLAARGDELTSDDPEVAKMLEELSATMVRFSEAADTFFKRLGKGK